MSFYPSKGNTFAAIQYTGASCALTGVRLLNGPLKGALPTGAVESTLQAVQGLGSLENNSLELAENRILFLGGVLLGLASKSKWRWEPA